MWSKLWSFLWSGIAILQRITFYIIWPFGFLTFSQGDMELDNGNELGAQFGTLTFGSQSKQTMELLARIDIAYFNKQVFRHL